jgi:hypothetical protein
MASIAPEYHFRPAAYAEIKAMLRAIEGLDRALEALEAAEQPRDPPASAPADHRAAPGYAGRLGHRQRPLHKILVVVPHLLG